MYELGENNQRLDRVESADEGTMSLIQGGISAVTVQVQRAIDATDPADYPLLLAVLEMSAKSFRQSLPLDACFLADLIEQLTASVAIALPADFRKKEGGHG